MKSTKHTNYYSLATLIVAIKPLNLIVILINHDWVFFEIIERDWLEN